MNKVFTAALVLAFLCPPAFPRQQTAAGGARLLDSFGELRISDLLARLDNFAVELQNEPGSKGFIVAYGAKHKFPGWPLRRANLSLNYLVNSRGLDAARLSVFNGGLREDTTFELWAVDAGAELPVKPFDVSLLMAGEKTPLPFDRFAIIERGDQIEAEYYEPDPYPDSAALYAYFADVLRHDPGLRGCVIAYTSRRGSRAADRRIAARVKMAIAKAHAVDVSRIAAFGGGRRDYKTIELWLVPPGAELPKPTPTVRPSRRKKR
jgi:hypothetical protein